MNNVILFNINIIKQSSIEALCRKLDLNMISFSDGSKPIQSIASGAKQTKPGTLGFSEEMIVFCGILPDIFDKFLDEYKKMGIAPVELKAVVTKYNAKWTPLMLYNQLSRERTALKK